MLKERILMPAAVLATRRGPCSLALCLGQELCHSIPTKTMPDPAARVDSGPMVGYRMEPVSEEKAPEYPSVPHKKTKLGAAECREHGGHAGVCPVTGAAVEQGATPGLANLMEGGEVSVAW